MADSGRKTPPELTPDKSPGSPSSITTKSDGVQASVNSDAEYFKLTLSFRRHDETFEFPLTTPLSCLFREIEQEFYIPEENIKVFVPRGGIIKLPLDNPDAPLIAYKDMTLKIMGTPRAEWAAMCQMGAKVAKRNDTLTRQQRENKSRMRKYKQVHANSVQYTFHQIKPLQTLPNPERSLSLLKRLAEDPGIRTAMRKHQFVVALLTEMDPMSNTQADHEGTSRILGLNRNKGEVIELRLRTDAYDGYRDYKTIRKTLCHELAHNAHSDHDRQFWDLCHKIEREVDASDWKSSGQTLGESSRYLINGQELHHDDHAEDEGGWSGGEFVLGGLGLSTAGLDRREILARAAVERERREYAAEVIMALPDPPLPPPKDSDKSKKAEGK